MAIIYGEVIALSSIVELQPLPGAADVRATALNRFGQVVGTSGGRSVIWEQGIPRELPMPGPNSISDDGRVVGGTSRTPQRAMLWEDDGTVIEIGPLPGHDQSRARINADGIIVGESWSDEEGLAFVWRDGVMTVLPPETGYDRSAAMYANATGMVIGTSEKVYTDEDPDEFVDFTVWQDGRVLSVVSSGRPAPPEEAWVGVSDAGDAYMHNTDQGFMSYRWRAGLVERFPTPEPTPNRHVFAVSADGYVLLGFDGVNGIWKDDVFRPLDEGIVSSCSAITVDGWLVCTGPGRQYQFLAQLEFGTPAPWVSDLAVADVDGPAVTLSWTQVDDGTGSPASYRLKYAAPPIAWRTATIGCKRTMPGTAIGAPMSCTVEGLQGTTAYEFQLMSFGVEDGVWVDAAYSNRAATTTGVVPVTRVTDLAVAGVTESSVSVRWTQVADGAGSPARYRVKYSLPPIGYPSATRACTIQGKEIGAELSCTIDDLNPVTIYDVQLMSYRVEDGLWVGAVESNVVTVATQGTPAEAAVNDLRPVAVGTDEVTLLWTQINDGTGNPASYRLKYGSPLGDWKNATIACERTIRGDEVGTDMSCRVPGLTPGTRYEFRLMSFRMEEGVWVNAHYSNMTFVTTATQ